MLSIIITAALIFDVWCCFFLNKQAVFVSVSLIIKRSTGYCRAACVLRTRVGKSVWVRERDSKCRLYIIIFRCCCIILWLPGLSTSTVLLLIKKTVDVITFGNK